METQSNSEPLVARNQYFFPPTVPFSPEALMENREEGGDIRQVFSVVKRRFFLILSIAFAISAATWFQSLKTPIRYMSSFQLLVEPVSNAESKLAGLTGVTGVDIQKAGLDYATQIEILESPELMSKIIGEIQQLYPDVTYGSLIGTGNLMIRRKGDTKILEIRYEDSDPKKIKFVLERVAIGYLRYSLQEQQTTLKQGIQFVEGELPNLFRRVNDLQTELEVFRQKYAFIEPDSLGEKLTVQATHLENQRLEIQQKLSEMKALHSTFQDETGATAALNQAELYQTLLAKVREVETQIAIESSRYNPGSSQIKYLLDQRQNLFPILRQEAQRFLGDKQADVVNQYRILQVRLQGIQQAEAQLSQQIASLPSIARQYTDLQRELALATDSLTRFMAKRESLQIEGAQKEIPWQLIAAPQLPRTSISQSMQRQLLLGILGGIMVGVGVAFFLEKLDITCHSLEDLKEFTKLPILGTIPVNAKLKKRYGKQRKNRQLNSANLNLGARNAQEVDEHSFFPFLEAFRNLYTNIRFLGSDQPIKAIVISSPAQKDGKSTVSANLAQAAAAIGRKVLLVDGDLRLPQVHRKFNLMNISGLSNLISGDLDPANVIQDVPFWENLSVLTAGQTPPDPTKLLSSNKMQNLMEYFKSNYDLVIYDTPPCTDLVDARLLAAHTDGLVMVVRLEQTDKDMLSQALDSLKLSRTTILGLVVNGSKFYQKSSANYYYHAASQGQLYRSDS